MTKLIAIAFLFLGLFSCKEKSKYLGFSVTNTGLNYKIHTLGDTESKLNDNDYVSFYYSKYSSSGELIVSNALSKNVLYSAVLDTGLMELLALISIGDSASYIKLNGGKEELISLKITSRNSNKIGELLKNHPEYGEQIPFKEQNEILAYLENYRSDSILYHEGMFIIHQIMGYGSYPVSGDEVTLEMESQTIYGAKLESTILAQEPFVYVLGVKDQVIKGIDFGVRQMRKGGNAIFIIPSPLAFGKQGSSTGLVKSNTPLIYNVQLTSVLKFNLKK